MFVDTIRVGKAECTMIEQETIRQSKCDKWFEMKAKKITSSNVHKVFQRKRNFHALAVDLLQPKSNSMLPQSVK